MILIPHTTQYIFIMVEVAPRDELGAPADPTNDHVTLSFSPTRTPPDVPVFVEGQWQTNSLLVPPKFYAMAPVGSQTTFGPLAPGLWWPLVRIESNPEIPDLIGEAFRVY